MKKKYYITTTLPYINAAPHAGFALEIIEADVLARFNRQIGNEVFFNTGTDEHCLKLYRNALKLGKNTQTYVDQQAEKFINLKVLLNLSFNNFIRTTDQRHAQAAQEFWRRCAENGDIYINTYEGKYCIGCESEKTETDLINGKCKFHPNQKIEIIKEKNYFFRFSRYQRALLDIYDKNPSFVMPKKRLNEIRKFVEAGLKDFSISRLKKKIPWGINVPGDSDHVIYVWFDALVNYISAIGWPNDMDKFNKWWPVTQLAGKDNLRQQSAMWQAMLLSAKIQPSKQIFINGFITVNNHKMSKSFGDVISPNEMVRKFGIDGTRYLLLSGGNLGEDMDITWERMTEKYNADLANGLGNLVSRVIKLSKNVTNFPINNKSKIDDDFLFLINSMEFGQALNYIWNIIHKDNKFIEENKPWELLKINQKKFKESMRKLIEDLFLIAQLIVPFFPETAKKIKIALETKMVNPLFQRIK